MLNNPFKDISTELWLMLACASGDTAKIQDILHQPVNWDMFLQLTVHHRVYPLVYKTINQLNNPVVPQYVVSHLRQKYRENVVRAISLAGETVRMVQCFESHGIRALVLKGAPLAWRLFGNLANRPSRDIDIMIAPDQLKTAQEVLESEGYCNMHPEYNINSWRQLQILKSFRHFVYRHSEKNIYLELHWELGYGLTIPAESDIKRIEVSGSPIPVLSDEKWLLFLMLHGARHAWFRLRWLVDIERFIQNGNIDWGNLEMMVSNTSMRMQSSFHQGLILANRLLDAPVPPNFQSLLKHDQTAWRLACTAMNICLATADNGINGGNAPNLNYYWKIYNVQLRIGCKNRFNYLLRYFRPSLNDFNLLALPDRLYSLYYIIRPFTWFGRFLRKLFRNNST